MSTRADGGSSVELFDSDIAAAPMLDGGEHVGRGPERHHPRPAPVIELSA
jgi:hypothetical protein